MRWYDRHRQLKCLRAPRKGAFTTWPEMRFPDSISKTLENPVGAGLPAMEVSYPALMAADPQLSLASQLPQG
ncbi:hypothetical protein [Pseudomonas fluorescens]|nr:hypothetical protein [Pseudomonas fluorescens]